MSDKRTIAQEVAIELIPEGSRSLVTVHKDRRLCEAAIREFARRVAEKIRDEKYTEDIQFVMHDAALEKAATCLERAVAAEAEVIAVRKLRESDALRAKIEYANVLGRAESAVAEVKRLTAELEWVKCSERLPEFNRPVLLYVGGEDRVVASNAEWAGRVFVGMLTASDGKWWSYAAHASGGPKHEAVTHWREIGPLPESATELEKR